MKLVIPSELTMVSSTADTSPYPEWDSATPYVAGDTVTVSDFSAHVRYEAITTTTGRDPTLTSGFWRLKGAVPIWDATTTWAVGAKVYRVGTTGHREYTAKKSSKGITPGVSSSWATYWTDNGDVLLWDAGTSFAAKQQCYVVYDYQNKEYESLTSNTNKPPPDNPLDWLDLGVTNPYRLIDASVSTKTYGYEAFETRVKVAGYADTLALFELENVSTVTIEIEDSGTSVYTGTFPVQGLTESLSWSDYFFSELAYRSSALHAIPGYYSDPVITVTLAGDTGTTVGCGHLVLGKSQYLGATQYGVVVGIKDYSRKETDEFGYTQLVERPYSRTLDVSLEIEYDQLDSVFDLLARHRAKPCVYDANYEGGDIESFRLFGFYTSHSETIEGWDYVTASIELESLT